MKVLHTADWHIGKTLYGKNRYEEFEAFLSWLVETLQSKQVDILVISGDVFDTSTPSNRSQELYYNFLCRVGASGCRHVIVTAGNHDSPSFLDAPKALLRVLNVHVIGTATDNPEDEVFLLKDQRGDPEAFICAVPYLRDRDLRTAEPGESIEDKERKLMEGIRAHYAKVCEHAEKQRSELKVEIPIIAMGHLFTAGGQTVEGDGVRELYIGSLAHVASAIFPQCIDYLALGHLHVPQKVNGSEIMRYSGSPIPMGFGESGQEKSVCLVSFYGKSASVELVKIPVFQTLERVRGKLDEILVHLASLSTTKKTAWLEVIYEGEDLIGNLREQLEAVITNTDLKLLRIKDNRIVERALCRIREDETLDDLNVHDVFDRCLSMHKIPETQHQQLKHAYQEIVRSLQEDDLHAK